MARFLGMDGWIWTYCRWLGKIPVETTCVDFELHTMNGKNDSNLLSKLSEQRY